MDSPFPYHRLIVLGTTGSGKSTLAERIAGRLDLDFIELDALHWQPGWVGTPEDEFLAKVDAATRSDRWVIAGNYGRTQVVTWPRAQAALWLDYPFATIFFRLLRRTIRRAVRQEILWGTNRERFWPHLKLWSDESLFHWLLRTYWRRKREYPQLFARPEYAHLQVFQFKTPQQAEAWLDSLPE